LKERGKKLAPTEISATKPVNKPEDRSVGIQELEAMGVQVRHLEKPSKEREAQQILAQAFKGKMKVLACGGGTSLGAGILPESVDLVLDTTGMNRVLAFDPRNLNLAVLGGMTLEAIDNFLSAQEKGFFLPLDPPLAHRATIGGVYAANASGPSRLRYGTVRDQALGVRGADAQGREVNFGGKTVKNVSGYDLTKFFIGSAGSLCLMTSISLRVYPLPEASSLCEIMLENLESLEKFLAALRSSILVPSAVVITQPSGEAAASRFRGLISFEGHGQAVERQNKDLLQLAEKFGGKGESHTGRDTMLKINRSVIDRDESAPDLLALKISVPIARGPHLYDSISKLAGEVPLKSALLAGNGIIFLNAFPSSHDAAARLIAGLKEIVQSSGGYMTPIRAHRNLLVKWGSKVEPTLHRLVLQPIKEKLDPTGVFPPIL
jgi:glycolate oxidase FAD binding subunit